MKRLVNQIHVKGEIEKRVSMTVNEGKEEEITTDLKEASEIVKKVVLGINEDSEIVTGETENVKEVVLGINEDSEIKKVSEINEASEIVKVEKEVEKEEDEEVFEDAKEVVLGINEVLEIVKKVVVSEINEASEIVKVEKAEIKKADIEVDSEVAMVKIFVPVKKQNDLTPPGAETPTLLLHLTAIETVTNVETAVAMTVEKAGVVITTTTTTTTITIEAMDEIEITPIELPLM
jgi:hypothetical protein